jgi:prepilin peptidase CpaA
MANQLAIASASLLVPLAALITYTDVRYRRIPNLYVLVTLLSGLLLNAAYRGFDGLLSGLAGCALAFALMLVLHLFGAMGAGDVKLFAAIGALIGVKLVLPTFAVVLLTGFVLALYTMLSRRIARTTLLRVAQFFLGFLPGGQVPRYAAPADRRHTLPYGAAITLGSLISLVLFRA